jgi:ATP-dependent DNA helicase 2 subunit 1
MALLDQNWGGLDDDTADDAQPGKQVKLTGTNDDNERRRFQIVTSRDGTLLLIECASEMFESLSGDAPSDEDADLKTGFQLVMRACQRFYQSKIISNDKDLSGIILYGTETNKNAFDFKHIYILHDLAQPSAERIIQLETLSKKDSYEKAFSDLFGSAHATNYSLNEALWTCSNLFANSPQRLTIKRVFIFTCNDQPHASNLILERQAKQRAKWKYFLF